MKRKPDELKVIEGTFREDRSNPDAPDYEKNIPKPSEHLQQGALIEWGRISTELYKLGLLADVDKAALEAYCQAYDLWCRSSIELEKEGFTIETSNGNKIQNPYVGIVNQSREHMRKFALEFGFTPASRNNVTAKPKKDKNKFTKYKKKA